MSQLPGGRGGLSCRAGCDSQQRRRARVPAGLRPLLPDRLRRARSGARARRPSTPSTGPMLSCGRAIPSARSGTARAPASTGRKEHFGADEAFPIDELASELPELLQNNEQLLYRLGRDRAFDDKIARGARRARARARGAASRWPIEIVDPRALLHEMRLFKSDRGARRDARAPRTITRDAHVGAMRLAQAGMLRVRGRGAAPRDVPRERLRAPRLRQHRRARARTRPSSTTGRTTEAHRRGRSPPHRCRLRVRLLRDRRHAHVPGQRQVHEAQRAIYELVLDAQLAAIAATRPGRHARADPRDAAST